MSVGTGWTYSHLTGTAKPNPGAGDISEADFGFDYSAFGIPEAPNSDPNDTATSGLRLATNITGFFGGTSVAAVYEDPNFFSGQYTVQVDAWLTGRSQSALEARSTRAFMSVLMWPLLKLPISPDKVAPG